MVRRVLSPVAALSLVLIGVGCTRPRPQAAAARTAVTVEELAKTTRSWDGRPLPAYPQGQPEVTIRRVRIPPGARLEAHLHPVTNAGVLVSGELTVVAADGQTLHLATGDSIVELVNTVHYGINLGTVPAEILVVYAGAVGTPIAVPVAEPRGPPPVGR